MPSWSLVPVRWCRSTAMKPRRPASNTLRPAERRVRWCPATNVQGGLAAVVLWDP